MYLNPLERFLIENRGWFVVFFVVPLSLIYDIAFRIRAWVIFKFYSAPELHKKRVNEISRRVKEHQAQSKNLEASQRKKLCTARGGWESISPGFRDYKKKSQCIPVNLYDILECNTSEKGEEWVRVEPMVNMGQISHYLIPRGFTLPVLPEMDDLTIGGLYMGVGIETTSHRFGLFNDIVLEAEIVLASGEIVTCSRTKNRDLFDALPWSYGTLGFLASVKLDIIPCKPYIKLEYWPVHDRTRGVALIEKFATQKTGAEFVESLMYSEHQMVVMRGNFASQEEVRDGGSPDDNSTIETNAIGWWYKPWFYKHVESFLKMEEKSDIPAKTEYIPLRDYYHRHTRAIFWEVDLILQPFDGNYWLFRYLFGWALPPKVSFLKLTQSEKTREMYEKEHVIQDMLIPIEKSAEGLEVFHKEYDIYPLWLCPFRFYDYSTDKSSSGKHRCFLRKPPAAKLKDDKTNMAFQLYLDLGAYGVPKVVLDKKPFDIQKVSRSVEHYVTSVDGFQMLYADSYLSKEEFRAMFDHSHYDAMKKKYDELGSFPEVFDKVSSKWKTKEEKKQK